MTLNIFDRIQRANSCLDILKTEGEKGKGKLPRALSAFQVLHHHHHRKELYKEFGPPGRGGGSKNSSSHWIMHGLMMLARYGLVEYHYVTTTGLAFVVGDEIVVPSAPVCAFYQLTHLGMIVQTLKHVPETASIMLYDIDGKAVKTYSHELLTEERSEE